MVANEDTVGGWSGTARPRACDLVDPAARHSRDGSEVYADVNVATAGGATGQAKSVARAVHDHGQHVAAGEIVP